MCGCGPTAIRSASPLIRAARGPFGTNAGYVYQLHSALTAEALGDDYVAALVSAIDAGGDGD